LVNKAVFYELFKVIGILKDFILNYYKLQWLRWLEVSGDRCINGYPRLFMLRYSPHFCI
jgi:hypothetical protein